MKRKILCITILSILSLFSIAQDGNWEVYMAQYEKGVGSTVVDFSLKATAPRANLPFVVITGVAFKDCNTDGMPTKKEFETLYKIADSVGIIINSKGSNTMAGTFTYQCQRLDYYYVSDTNGVRQSLQEMYKRHFENYEPYINMRIHEQWESYLQFLYPNEETWSLFKIKK